MDKLSTQEILDARLDDWRKLAQALHARYRVADFRAAAAFAAAVAEAAAAAGHQPDLKMTQDVVDVSLCTREGGLWVTDKDIGMARKITEIARQQGLRSEPTAVTQIELGLDTADDSRVAPFWSVLLTGSPDNNIYDSVFDPTSRVPSVWFQRTGEHETPRQRWHFDLWLAPATAAAIRSCAASGASHRSKCQRCRGVSCSPVRWNQTLGTRLVGSNTES